MQAKKSLTRSLKFLGKAVAGLLLLLVLLLLITHLPFVQQKITNKAESYLSQRLNSKVEIGQIRFSLFGNLRVKTIRLWDPVGNEILSLETFRIQPRIRELLSGNFILDEVRIEHIRADLTGTPEGSNFDFILNAFSSTPASDTVTSPFSVQILQVSILDAAFTYRSVTDSMNVAVLAEACDAHDFVYTSEGNAIRAGALKITGPAVNVFMPSTVKAPHPKPDAPATRFFPDMGTGLQLDVDTFSITDGRLQYHIDSVYTPVQFDPEHLQIDAIQVSSRDFRMDKESLSVLIRDWSLHIPGMDTLHASAEIAMSSSTADIHALRISTGETNMEGEISASYREGETPGTLQTDFKIRSYLRKQDLVYLIPPAFLDYIKPFTSAELQTTGRYANGTCEADTFLLRTPDSRIQAHGVLKNINQPQALAWEKLEVHASVGADLKSLITAQAGDIALPPTIYVDVQSTGNTEKLYSDINVQTPWGTMAANGSLSVLNGVYGIDMNVSGQRIQANRWADLPWLGPADASMTVKGTAGRNQDLKVSGMIHRVEVMEQPIQDIAFDSQIEETWMSIHADVQDPAFKSTVDAEVISEHGIVIDASVNMDQVQAGRFIAADSSLVLTGQVSAWLEPDESSILAMAVGSNIVLTNTNGSYTIDSFDLDAFLLDHTINSISYTSPDVTAHIKANFNLTEAGDIVKTLPAHFLSSPDSLFQPGGTKELDLALTIRDDQLIRLLGMNMDTFSTIRVEGHWSEPLRTMDIEARSQALGMYDIHLDSMKFQVNVKENQITASGMLNQVAYSSSEIGDVELNVTTEADTLYSRLSIRQDTTVWLDMVSHLVHSQHQLKFYPDELHFLEKEYVFPGHSSITWQDGRFGFEDFLIQRDSMQIRMDGHEGIYHADLSHLDLRTLNAFISPDEEVIDYGMLSLVLSYDQGKQFELDAHIDSLQLFSSAPMAIDLKAHTEDHEVPFRFQIHSGTDLLTLDGRYTYANQNVKARANLNITDPQRYHYLFSSYIRDPKGAITAEADLDGYILDPRIHGSIQLKETSFETPKLRMRFRVPDEEIAFTDTSIVLKDFTVVDEKSRPLRINGQWIMPKAKPFHYDFKVEADHYTLLNTKEGSNDLLSGTLILSTTTRMSGTADDTYIENTLTIEDSTSLVYLLPSDEDGLTDIKGIVEFVNPEYLEDSTLMAAKESVYDSLLATLPKFNLKSSITIADQARLKILIDKESGDYIEAIGGGKKLDLEYDRTGNLHLAGNYTIQSGVYRLSFYGLIKRNFNLVPGSSIDWSGNPRSGDLNIKAVHTVQSNSIGLIGNEISENEKSVYKRSLDYEIGININGTLEKPNVFFTLDLPAADKANYPVLANKLDRLRQPEFQSELNKQVFGLLALGGFLPESSTADVSSTQIATTALYNSVNSVLAAQLNRFAGQYLKGINIDVGLQSYSDYSTAGGKTQTAMDFRVSKSILDDRLSFEVGGDFDINSDQSGSNTGDNYRGDVAIIYDLTGNGDKQLKLFNNESYDIVYQEIRNTGISLIFIREFNKGERKNKRKK